MFDNMLGMQKDPRIKQSLHANPLFTLKVSPFLQPGNQRLTDIFLKETGEKPKIQFGLDRSNIVLTAPNGKEITTNNIHRLNINATGSEIAFDSESVQTNMSKMS